MKKLIESWRQFLNESSLSRLRKHMEEHDCAILTGFRGDLTDVSNCRGKKINASALSNEERNRDLKAHLLHNRYGVTTVDGSYIENFDTPQQMKVKEDSLFVVNLKDNATFNKNVLELGQEYCQDSVLIIPRGGKGAFLMGTNEAEFPGFGKRFDVGNAKFGKDDQFSSKVRNRPFVFKENLETFEKLSKNSKWIVTMIVERQKEKK